MLPALSSLVVAYATPTREAENPDFIRLLRESLTNELAIIYAVANWFVFLLICLAKKNSPARSKPNLARTYIHAVAIWLDVCILRRAENRI